MDGDLQRRCVRGNDMSLHMSWEWHAGVHGIRHVIAHVAVHVLRMSRHMLPCMSLLHMCIIADVSVYTTVCHCSGHCTGHCTGHCKCHCTGHCTCHYTGHAHAIIHTCHYTGHCAGRCTCHCTHPHMSFRMSLLHVLLQLRLLLSKKTAHGSHCAAVWLACVKERLGSEAWGRILA